MREADGSIQGDSETYAAGNRLLRKALQQTVVWQFRVTNPADAVDAPRVPEREIQPIDEERPVRLIDAADGTSRF